MANGHGGARPGTGRKPHAEKYIGPITAANEAIASRLPDLVSLAFELAEGVEVRETLPNGGTKVYSRPPDIKAITYLVDRIMGKPTERREVSGEDGAPIPVALSMMSTDDLRDLRRILGNVAGG